MSKKRDVYCIGTEKNGTMIANGIITKNCDALRYAVMGLMCSKDGKSIRTNIGMAPRRDDPDFGRALGYDRTLDNGYVGPSPYRM